MEINTPHNVLPPEQRPLSFKQWALYIFIAGLPLIGLIMLLLWGFGNDGNIHRKSWAQGMLLLMVIGIALALLIFLLFGISLAALAGMQ